MRVTYNALVQKDVNRILKWYDGITTRLGDEFWSELNSQIEATARNPGRGHPAEADLRRVNLTKFPYHFLFRMLPGKIRVTVVRHHKRRPSYGLRRRRRPSQRRGDVYHSRRTRTVNIPAGETKQSR